MTRRELIISAINHQACRRVPYHIPLTVLGYEAYGEQLMKDYPDERVREHYAKRLLSLSEAVDLSIGNHMLYVNCPWWNWHKLPPEFSGEDTPQIMPRVIGTGNYEKYFEHLAFLRENYDVYLLNTVWGSHWEKAYFCRGIENFLADLAADPEWAGRLLKMIIRKNIVMLENILQAEELDGVLLGSDWGTQRDLIMSPACWRELIKDGEQQEYDLIRAYGKNVFVHSCGKVDRIMDDLVEMGLEVLNPVQPECMELSGLKRDYGDKLTFFGGISTQRTLPYGTPEEVWKETEDTIRLMSVNGGYITAPSQEIQTDVPYENLRALIDAAREASR